jgi:hypothetical protein
VDEQILRLDVAMAHPERMNVGERAAELVSVQLRTQGHVAVRIEKRRHLGPRGRRLGAQTFMYNNGKVFLAFA